MASKKDASDVSFDNLKSKDDDSESEKNMRKNLVLTKTNLEML